MDPGEEPEVNAFFDLSQFFEEILDEHKIGNQV